MFQRHAPQWVMGLALVAGAVSACKSKSNEDRPAPKANAVTPAPLSPQVESPKPARSVAITEAQALALVEAWALAQNQGNLAAYSQLYAPKFTGTKRATSRVTHHNRDTWLKDRTTMFATPFSVSVKDAVVNLAPGLAMVTFTQDWSNATFRDRGSKRMVLVPGDSGPQISVEEMLASTDAGTGNAGKAFDAIALVAQSTRGPALIFAAEADASWASGEPAYGTDFSADKAILADQLPPSLRARLSATYEIFDASGALCEARASEARLMARVTPHFGTLQAWNGATEPPSPPVSIQERARDLWSMAASSGAGHGLELGLVLPPMPACPSPVWGRLAAPTPASVWTVRSPTAQEHAQLESAAQGHPAVRTFTRQMQQEWEGQRGSWLQNLDKNSLRRLEGPGAVVYWLGVASGAGGCSSRAPAFATLVWRGETNALQAVPAPLYAESTLLAAADFDKDGLPELIFADQVRSLAHDRILLDVSTLNLDCGC